VLLAARRSQWFRVSSYNLEQFVEMQRWCSLGQRRFPDQFRFVACQLQLMTTPAVAPDLTVAWSLLACLDSLAPPNQRAVERLRGHPRWREQIGG
jgi:hypothetical protein